jgi:hypothetical protein
MDGISAISAVSGGNQLTLEQQAQVQKLAARDRDVRAHEAAHLAAAGSLANGVEYTYELGPDGKLYAVGGKVKISVPPGLTPEETLAEARRLRSAANAPSDPSGQDMAVALRASEMESRALEQIAKDRSQTAQAAPGSSSQTPFRRLDRTA